jgi:hypothetical protein
MADPFILEGADGTNPVVITDDDEGHATIEASDGEHSISVKVHLEVMDQFAADWLAAREAS